MTARRTLRDRPAAMSARKTLPPPPPRLREMAKRVYPQALTDDALKEASRPENVGPEVAMLRAWLEEAAGDTSEGAAELLLALFDRTVKAVAVRYRLSPRSTDHLASALKGIFDGLAAIDAERDEEEV